MTLSHITKMISFDNSLLVPSDITTTCWQKCSNRGLNSGPLPCEDNVITTTLLEQVKRNLDRQPDVVDKYVFKKCQIVFIIIKVRIIL